MPNEPSIPPVDLMDVDPSPHAPTVNASLAPTLGAGEYTWVTVSVHVQCEGSTQERLHSSSTTRGSLRQKQGTAPALRHSCSTLGQQKAYRPCARVQDGHPLSIQHCAR